MAKGLYSVGLIDRCQLVYGQVCDCGCLGCDVGSASTDKRRGNLLADVSSKIRTAQPFPVRASCSFPTQRGREKRGAEGFETGGRYPYGSRGTSTEQRPSTEYIGTP